MKINLLDCTLREAPIKNLILGQTYIHKFINALEKTNIDIIECGFLKNVEYNPESTIFNKVEEFEKYLQKKAPNKLYVALVDYGRYDLKNLSDYNGKSIDGIRICFKKHERFDVFDYAQAIKDKGYKVFFQNVDTLGYSDYELLEVIDKVNKLSPYAYSIVDTFGAMYANDLRHVFEIVNYNLDENIILGFHAHNNLMLANSNTQEFVNLASQRKEINVDASVLGCGRGAGNAHTELLAEFLNKNYSTNYNLNELLDIIDYLMPKFINDCEWGYSIPYFLSGVHNSHVFNVNHLLGRHNIQSKDLRAIIEKLDENQKKAYDYKLLEKLYVEHFQNPVADENEISKLSNMLNGRKVLCIAPGISIKNFKKEIDEYIKKRNPVVIAVNNFVEGYKCDFIFMSSIKRYQELSENEKLINSKLILTSNIKTNTDNNNEFIVDYKSLIKFGWINVDTSSILLIRLLIKLGISNVAFAGFDGFNKNAFENYYDKELITTNNTDDLLLLTKETKEMLEEEKSNININFITPSQYQSIFEDKKNEI